VAGRGSCSPWSPFSRRLMSMRRVSCPRSRQRPHLLVRRSAPPLNRCERGRPLPHRLGGVPLGCRRCPCGSGRRHDEPIGRRGLRISRGRAAVNGRVRHRHRGGRRGRRSRRRSGHRRRQRRLGFGLPRGHGRGDGGTRRQERQRIDVALVLRRRAQTEEDVRLGMIRHAARPDGADDGPLGDGGPTRDRNRPEVHQRRRVPERSLDRDRLAAGRHGAGECDDALCRREHVRPGRRAEVDPAVLPARIRMSTIEREGTEDRPVDGPRPRLRGRREQECAEHHETESPDHEASLLPDWRTERPYQGRVRVVNTGYKVRR
jgi:hypothetical protein